ncbi:MAG: class I SAM-dependent methyltransferase [Chloroflexi bacterium]|nr:class I SAM-dependent methyltransferase [Chloroflexota bacterium]
MSQADRQRWEQRYADPADSLKKTGPHSVLARHAPSCQPGCRALELACGLGRDALWLAEQGWRVEALDISLTALIQARAEMVRRKLSGVHFVVADLDHFPLPRHEYDLVYVFRFLDRRLFPAIAERVRPGGLVIYETLNIHWLKSHPDTRPDHMLQLGELPGYFPGWTVIESSDGGVMSTFVGRRP